MVEPLHFDEFELEYIHTQLAIKTPLHIIAQQFRQLYEKDIKGQHLQAIALRDKHIIVEIARRELSNINACPLSYARVRMEYLYRALEDACSPKVLRSVKESEIYIDRNGDEQVRDVYKPVFGIDQSAIKGLIDSAQKEQMWGDKITLDKIARGIDTAPTGGGVPVVTAYTGYEEEDEKLLIESNNAEA